MGLNLSLHCPLQMIKYMEVRIMEKTIKILMVDDEEDFTQPMAFWFKTKGYEVSVANNGETALEKIKTDKPDIVFQDLNRPELIVNSVIYFHLLMT